jgi:hypothetical protein
MSGRPGVSQGGTFGGWAKALVALALTALVAVAAAHERLNITVDRVAIIEREQVDLRKALQMQAETNGRIDERTVRILDEVGAMRRQMRGGN